MDDVQRELISILERLDEREQEVLLFEARELEQYKKISRQHFLAYGDASRAAHVRNTAYPRTSIR